MTQPAKVQEPSMEEILASIRRIIADDEAKPPPAEKPAGPQRPEPAEGGKAAAPAPRQASGHDRHSAVEDCACRRRQKPRHRRLRHHRAPPAPACRNNQDDIDALLSGFDEATSAEGDSAVPAGSRGVRTDRRDGGAKRCPAAAVVPEGRAAGRYRIHRIGRLARDQPAAGLRAAVASTPRRRSRFFRSRRSRRSNPPSTRSPTRCSATTPGRWRIWSRKCCGRC